MNVWLYVEDNPADAELVRFVLQEHCPEVLLAIVKDGDEALAYLRKPNAASPDLILMDLGLPRMSGVDLLREIRQALQLRSTPVIVFSASEHQQTVAKCYEAGATSFVLKPSDLDDLVQTLKHIAKFWRNFVAPASNPQMVPDSSGDH